MAAATRTSVSIDDTTGSTVAGDHAQHRQWVPATPPDADGALSSAGTGRPAGGPPVGSDAGGPSRGWVALGVVLTLLAGAIICVFTLSARIVGVDTYVLAPGSATDTAPAIQISGTESYPPEGEIAFTTVSIRRDVTIWEWAQAKWFDDSSELVPPELIDGNRTTEETRQVTQFQMDQSQDTATVVALNYLGFDVVPEVEGAFVLELVEGSPAAEALRLGDLIVKVNDTDVRSSEDLSVAIQAQEPGSTVAVELKRSAQEQGGSGADPDAVDVSVDITLAPHPEVAGAGFLGVRIETPIRADAPFDVIIDVGRVRGPSAGLAFSLSIVDVLTEGELTGGIDIATTGTIDRFGNIGPVGGVPQKTQAAIDAGIELFLVPPNEYGDAIRIAGDRLDVRCVQTFDDAVLALAEFGGNGVEVAEEFGAEPPAPSPSPVDDTDGYLSCAEAIAQFQ